MRVRLAAIVPVLAAALCACPQLHAQSSAQAKVLASCPAKPGKKLLTVRLTVMPGGRALDGDGDDSGTEWGQTHFSQIQPGEHAVLECGYGAPNAAPDGAVTVHTTVPVPSAATYCWSDNGAKVTGKCYDKKPGS